MTTKSVQVFAPFNLMDAVTRFYLEELGLASTGRTSDALFVSIPAKTPTTIEIIFSREKPVCGRTGLALHVTNFETAYQELNGAGHYVTNSIRREARIFDIADPTGNIIAVVGMATN
ncbi:hypothetical protein SAMN05443551_4048 [Marivita hallyeonensis]|uniref:VOC domain-containing protein n=1 Tax=Marivita hallyeonensis TaxID=996342 RepID=A0A1M5XP07_9RHOB|nr:hypothetical protein SAMN05443551_4048 [Marivita hallyeonensis]